MENLPAVSLQLFVNQNVHVGLICCLVVTRCHVNELQDGSSVLRYILHVLEAFYMTSIQPARVVTTSTTLPPTAPTPLPISSSGTGMVHARKGDTRYKRTT